MGLLPKLLQKTFKNVLGVLLKILLKTMITIEKKKCKDMMLKKEKKQKILKWIP